VAVSGASKTRLEQVADALQADPPRVRGLREGGKLRPLIEARGAKARKVFIFDLVQPMLYSEAIRRYRDIVLPEDLA
jgi:hypothetical protein